MRWSESTYPRFAEAAGRRSVAVLPFGAIEAHGPHLPVGTDLWIAEAMAEAGVRRLRDAGFAAWVLPSLPYTPAPFSNGFAGTLSIRPATLVALVVDIAEALVERGVEVLAFANAHFDPAHLGALREAAARVAERGRLRLVFPDLTRRRLAARLTDEFQSGACHAGRYEGSIVLATRPELVDEQARAGLKAVPVSLAEAIRTGQSSFERAGLPLAYCGDPAAATAAEGHASIERLGEILAEEIVRELG